MDYSRPDLADRLAAEYALGTIAVIALVAAVIAYLSGEAFDRQIVAVFNEITQWILSFIGK